MYFSKLGVYLIFLTIILITNAGHSQSITKMDKLETYANVSGLNEMFDEMQNNYEVSIKKYADTLFNNLKDDYPKLTPKYEMRIKKVYQKYLMDLNNRELNNNVRRKYLELIEPQFSEEDLDKLIEFYKSPIGRKSVRISKEITPIWGEYVSNERNKAMAVALKPTQKELDKIIKEYHSETDSWLAKILTFIF